MATKAYLMVTVREDFYRDHYQNVLRDLKVMPELDSIERIVGTCDLLVKITAPVRVDSVANKILAKEWVKQLQILKVEPFHPQDYEGLTIDELIKLKRLIHESRDSHGSPDISP
jgi:hypothetical protein